MFKHSRRWLFVLIAALIVVLFFVMSHEVTNMRLQFTNFQPPMYTQIEAPLDALIQSQSDLELALTTATWLQKPVNAKPMLSIPMPEQPRAKTTYIFKLTPKVPTTTSQYLHITRIYSSAYAIVDENFNILSSRRFTKTEAPYARLISESYTAIPNKAIESTETKGTRGTNPVYILIEPNLYDMHIGLGDGSRMLSFDELLANGFDFYQTRQAVSLLLLIVSLVTFGVVKFVPTSDKQKLMVSLATFTGCFGLWSVLDFSRNSQWILSTFGGIPISILLTLYSVTSFLMMPAFVFMNLQLMERARHRAMVRNLFFFALFLAIVLIILDFHRLFVWTPGLNKAYDFLFYIQDLAIIGGSLLLIIIALFDMPFQKRNGILYVIGLIVCLASFSISQATPYLVSHWGVVWLLLSIVAVLTLTFIEAQHEKRAYLDQVIQSKYEVERLNLDLEMTQTELLLRLGSTVDMRSKETSMHVQRVSAVTQILAEALGFPPEEAKTMAMASTLHDIGKVGIPDRILNEPGKLTPEDFDAMKTHAQMGFDILNGSYNHFLDIAAIIAYGHHEKYDGTGYPNGIAGDDIPMIAAIVAAADVFDALLSKRIYKPAWPFEEVIAFFIAQRGKHFNPKVVDAMLASETELLNLIATMPYA